MKKIRQLSACIAIMLSCLCFCAAPYTYPVSAETETTVTTEAPAGTVTVTTTAPSVQTGDKGVAVAAGTLLAALVTALVLSGKRGEGTRS